MHATEYLKAPAKHEVGPAVAVFGADRFLRGESIREVCRAVFGDDEADSGPVRLPGKTAELATVFDSLRTVSMWSERQMVIVEDADEFVTSHRAELERYFEKPARKGVFLLDLKSFPGNTRLYKKVAAIGLVIDCSALKADAATAWVIDHARQRFQKKLDRPAAQMLVDLAGTDLGLLVQELAKLAAFVGTDSAISADAVQAVVGGWRTRTTWEMLDAVAAGQPGSALQMLEKLLVAGEAVPMLLGGVNWMFRPLAQAAELARQGLPLGEAIPEAGVRPNNLRTGEAYLRRMGYARASQIGRWLLQADLDVKGGSSLPERVIVERLLVLLSGRS